MIIGNCERYKEAVGFEVECVALGRAVRGSLSKEVMKN